MTNKEAIQQLEQVAEICTSTPLAEAALMGARALEDRCSSKIDVCGWVYDDLTIEPMRWIPVTERLPEFGQDVMISVGGMYSAEGCLRDDGDWYQFRWSAIIPKDRVTAWCALPESYKGG